MIQITFTIRSLEESEFNNSSLLCSLSLQLNLLQKFWLQPLTEQGTITILFFLPFRVMFIFLYSNAENSWDRVAPGMSAKYCVRFCPDTDGDHSADITFTTEREKFAIPIRAIGARGFLPYYHFLNLFLIIILHSCSQFSRHYNFW